ncbi:TPA: BppU family phage baseplate upper protein [Enterococcus hirae]|uniref:BppU family phage baseplate upper protein n=2 Tax=Enterococcus hirae TaxID=1354 RepID=UPI00383D48C9
MEKKTGEIIVPTEPTNPPAKVTGFTFKSYDKKAGVLQFEIKNQDGSPTDLINATVRLFMYIYSGEEKKEFPIFDNQIITESYMQGIVKYFIPDMLLAYEGKVDANVYIDFPDGSHTDNLAFTFNIEKSIIDRDVQLNGEYYFKDFQQLLDGIKQETTDAVNEALTNVDSTIEKANQQINNFVEDAAQSIDQTVVEVTEELKTTQSNIDTVSQNVVSTQNELTLIKDKMNQTNQQIGDLGKLKKMYSNSIDFGDYDYSGNPNLLSTITSDYFTTKDNVTIANENRGVKLTFRNSGFGAETGNVMQIKPQTTYTLSAKVTVNEDFVGDLSKIRLTYRKFPGGNILLGTNLVDTLAGETKMISVTGSVSEMKQVERTYLRLDSNSQIVDGSISIEYIKLEEGAIPTPYHPNLFEKPWQISKFPLNENLANQSIVFPINTSTYNLYAAKMKKNLEIGKTMTITLKGTKPVNQSFKLFGNGSIDYGTLTPVNGLVDTWRLTFTPNEVATANPSNIELYQVPKNSLGNCTIEWLKIEEGEVATPNIIDYKYFGEGLKDSDNPNDYSWNITPEYSEQYFISKSSTEKGLLIYKNNFITTEDWNSIQTSGIYYCAGATGENMPISGTLYGYLIVIKSASVIVQLFISNGNFYNRVMSGSPLTWFNWNKLSNDSTVVHNSGNESIDGFKDFRQTPTVNNVPVALDRFVSKTVKTTNTTDFTNESSVRFERDGRSVVANFSITNKSANFAGWKVLMPFPRGYNPISLKDWGGTLANKTNRNPALSVYANASGIVVMVSTTNLPENQECSGTVSYFTNDSWPS